MTECYFKIVLIDAFFLPVRWFGSPGALAPIQCIPGFRSLGWIISAEVLPRQVALEKGSW